ncbi:cytochrome P450 71D9-like [Tripterygium wilfordii]|uniref:cytochrome P450 71D9-like n=1 Tax=Tripterygium wilfordii TaxID=458696 RepID=UPI0018F7FA45|nr:cytochrome P450 71D9-like [Tripterygium wilfordii]
MEIQSSSFPILACSIFFTLMVFQILKRSKSTSKRPPGPWKLPLIGNLHQIVGSDPHLALRDLAKNYGPLMYLQIGEVPTLVVSSAKYAKEVLKTHDIAFASRPKLNVAKILTFDFTNISFAPYGEYWRNLRKISLMELFTKKRIQSFQSTREQEMSNLIDWVSSNAVGGSPINLTEKVFSSMYTVVSRVALGGKSEEQDEFISVIKESSELVGGFNIQDVFPSLKLLHLISGVSSRLENIHQRSSNILQNIINKHIKAKTTPPKDEKYCEQAEDLVDVLLKFHKSDAEFQLTVNNIKAIIQDVFGAGSETSSSTVDWAMVEMIKDPRVMKKAQAEVRQVFDDTGSFDKAAIPELKYLKLIIKETLRLHPPVPLLLPRENSELQVIDGYEIPAKTRVVVNAWAIGRDTEYWVDAERFYPERFLDSPIEFKGTNFEYIPFGAGRRICPGMMFGLANVEIMLSQLLYHFDWKLPDGTNLEDLNMTDSFGVTMRRKDDLYLIPTPIAPTESLRVCLD